MINIIVYIKEYYMSDIYSSKEKPSWYTFVGIIMFFFGINSILKLFSDLRK